MRDTATGLSSASLYVMTPAQIRRHQIAQGNEPCFGTDHRFHCQSYSCPLRRRCCVKRVAEWKR